LFRGVTLGGPSGVATQDPSEMVVMDNRKDGFFINPLADYPPGTFGRNDGGRLDERNNHFAISIREPKRGGRMVVLADRDVFSNDMMGFVRKPDGEYENDNDNWGLANRTIDWLKGGSETPRTHCLFIEDGQIKTQFAVPIPQMPKSPIPDLPPE